MMKSKVASLKPREERARITSQGYQIAALASGVCLIVVMIFSGCGTAVADNNRSSTPRPDVTKVGIQDPRELDFAILDDVRATILRGSVLTVNDDPNARTLTINITPRETDLATIQWNAYQAQKAVWTSMHYRISSGWTVSVQQNIYDKNFTATLLGSVNVSEPHGYAFDWAHLSPQQAWAKYDSTMYHGG